MTQTLDDEQDNKRTALKDYVKYPNQNDMVFIFDIKDEMFAKYVCLEK